jgi:hypothetical protein
MWVWHLPLLRAGSHQARALLPRRSRCGLDTGSCPVAAEMIGRRQQGRGDGLAAWASVGLGSGSGTYHQGRRADVHEDVRPRVSRRPFSRDIVLDHGRAMRNERDAGLRPAGWTDRGPAGRTRQVSRTRSRRSESGPLGGTFRIGGDWIIAKIQLPHYRSLGVSDGTIRIGPSRHLGTFAFRLRDAARVTGRWTCG